MNTETWTKPLGPAGPSYVTSQRLEGYADNDGRYVTQRIAPTHWSRIGTLQRTGASRVLGVFDTLAEAEEAVAADLELWAREEHRTASVH